MFDMKLFDCIYSPQFDISTARNPKKDYCIFARTYDKEYQNTSH